MANADNHFKKTNTNYTGRWKRTEIWHLSMMSFLKWLSVLSDGHFEGVLKSMGITCSLTIEKVELEASDMIAQGHPESAPSQT